MTMLSHHRARRGASALEFALVLPVLMTVFGAIVEISLYVSTMHRVSRIARDAARVGSVIIEGPDPTGDLIMEAAEDHAWLALEAGGVRCSNGCTVDVDWELDDESGFMVVDVAVRVEHRGVTGFMPLLKDVGVGSRFVMLSQQQL